MKETIYLGMFLAVISAVAAGILGMTYVATYDRIAAEKQKEIAGASEVVLAGKNGKAIQVSPKGYAGNIDMLVGVDDAGIVTGVKIIKSNETPGLGLNADNPDFLNQFIGKTEKDKIEAKDDIQAITGATITTKAICSGVREALLKAKGSKAPPK